MIKEETFCRLEIKEPKMVWFQTIFTKEDKKISLIHKGFMFKNIYYWEILCLNGNLFDDVETFETLQEAMKKIAEYFNKKVKVVESE